MKLVFMILGGFLKADWVILFVASIKTQINRCPETGLHTHAIR